MLKLFFNTVTLLMERLWQQRKITFILWTLATGVLFGFCCYILSQVLATQIGLSPAIAIMAYVFIAGEILIALIAVDKFEKFKRPFLHLTPVGQNVLDVLMRKENHIILLSIAVMIVGSLLLPKIMKKTSR
jgi:hypothetical protein